MTAPGMATTTAARETQLARWINILALFALIGVLASSLHLHTWAFITFAIAIVAISVPPECGLGMCPDDPNDITGVGDAPGWAVVMSIGLIALAISVGIVMDRRLVPHGSDNETS